MKYLGTLITEARRDSRNEDVPSSGEDSGINTEDFRRWANYAQDTVVGRIIAAKGTIFRKSKTLDLEDGEIEYDLEDNVYMGEHVLKVEYSNSGEDRDFYQIPEKSAYKRDDNEGTPSFYIRQTRKLLLCPVYNSSGAKIRALFERVPDAMDLRRGVVASVTLSGGAVTALNITADSTNGDELDSAQFICICNDQGTPQMYNIPVSSYNSSTGTVTIRGTTFTYATGETITAGDYVTIGKWTRTHCDLDPNQERYIQLYTTYKGFGRDASSDKDEVKEEMRDCMKEILAGFELLPRDGGDVEIVNDGLVLGDAWYD